MLIVTRDGAYFYGVMIGVDGITNVILKDFVEKSEDNQTKTQPEQDTLKLKIIRGENM